jgi:hypothetical protein
VKASLKELSVVFTGVYIKEREHGEEACIALDVDYEIETRRGRKSSSAGWEKRMMEALDWSEIAKRSEVSKALHIQAVDLLRESKTYKKVYFLVCWTCYLGSIS